MLALLLHDKLICSIFYLSPLNFHIVIDIDSRMFCVGFAGMSASHGTERVQGRHQFSPLSGEIGMGHIKAVVGGNWIYFTIR